MRAPRLRRLDHFRALAAILVVLWHSTTKSNDGFPLFAILREGHTGVSLFCVISGFIFAYKYLDHPIGYRDFMKRRALRIGPLLIFYLVLAYYTSGMTGDDLASIISTLPKYGASLSPLVSQVWSVLIEVQFYLIFPFLIAITRTSGTNYLLCLLLFFVVLRMLIFAHLGNVQPLGYWTIFGRIDQFLAGMIAGVAVRRGAISRRSAMLCGVAGSVAILAFFGWYSGFGGFLRDLGPAWSVAQSLWIFLPAIEAVGYAAIIIGYIMAPTPRSNIITAKLSLSLSFLGMISYSIYLNQFLILPLFKTTDAYTGLMMTGWGGSAIIALTFKVPVIAAVSAVTYYLIEAPFERLKTTTIDRVVVPSV